MLSLCHLIFYGLFLVRDFARCTAFNCSPETIGQVSLSGQRYTGKACARPMHAGFSANVLTLLFLLDKMGAAVLKTMVLLRPAWCHMTFETFALSI